MAPVNQKQYRFSPESIVQLRERLGLSQAELARSLGVPPNTLSRWEIGTTTPDASSLAAIHSIAMERGITPSFFRKRKQTAKQSRLLVVWDFQNIPAQDQYLRELDAWIRAECEERFSATSQRTFKAFVRLSQWYRKVSDTASELDDLDWVVQKRSEDLTEEIIHYCKSRCGQDSSLTTLILIANDGVYADIINELKDWGVKVYLIGVGFGQDLVDAVGERHLIELPWPQGSPSLSSNPFVSPMA